MIELLSLPKRPKAINVDFSALKMKNTGLPLNSLPGWEDIPLNYKLPMLTCPGNQVVFTTSKIGESIAQESKNFDVSPGGIPEYSPLQDPNLKSFYAIERNLRRLRENGEITKDNDIICNLRDFNEFRQKLHKSRVGYVVEEMKKMEEEQHDRMLIAQAEYIASCDHENITAHPNTHNDIIQRKLQADEERQERFKKLWKNKLDRIAYIRMRHDMQATATEHRKVLRDLGMRRHWDKRDDIYRRKLNALKKLLHIKNDRLKKNLRKLRQTSEQQSNEKQEILWKKRMAERVAKQNKIRQLMNEMEEQRKRNITNHMTDCKRKWTMIQNSIKSRSLHNRKLIKVQLHHEKSSQDKHSLCAEYQKSFDLLHEGDICQALNTALDLQDDIKVPFNPDDPIYKAAQFIMDNILKNFTKDLFEDNVAQCSLYERIDQLFDETKKFVIFRATQIISARREAAKAKQDPSRKNFSNHQTPSFLHRTSMGRVSFNRISSTIGTSSYEIHPLIEIREVNHRRPTPAGSLASIVIDSTTSLAQRTPSLNLSRNDLVFIEHYFIKFKRDLIVGIGRRVFAAIQCHFEDKIMDVRHELLEIDRTFLIKRTTKSILSYAVNPLDFESNLKLCISSISSDIIWSLQKVLLKPSRDPRRCVKPFSNCYCKKQMKMLCL
ncbi:uncharacterized protein LOC142231677 [Haematobia irritans]|uniref:uncharacterized protein LOC142231677 n=1 Tax=Haematobia irritans TaxID=7368 RepID=UPI003F507C8D